jgi:YD repeat-containing protein
MTVRKMQGSPANRLLRSSSPAGDTWVYTYDASGNRTKVTQNGVVQQQPTFNSANQISSTGYGYDGAGNLTAPRQRHPVVQRQRSAHRTRR